MNGKDATTTQSASMTPTRSGPSSSRNPTQPINERSPENESSSAGPSAAPVDQAKDKAANEQNGPTSDAETGSEILSTGSQESGVVNDEPHDWMPEGDHELKRVKVYELIGSRWVDQGTAFCFGQFQEDTNEALLIARAEANCRDVILSTAIRSNDVYQRQQDTLIVWTEPDGVDYALSFQDPDGCLEVWNFILDVQRHMNGGASSSSPIIGPEPSITAASIIRSGHLPVPQLGIIGEIERAIKTLARTQAVKERICEYIQQEEYIKSLIDVMNTAEDLESLENLHALCSIMQTILMLNDHSMYEHILDDDIFFGVVGMLEYDAEFPTHKANYRSFLNQVSHFHQPIPIRDEAIQKKVHHTYRLQFMKDVVLARALDDSTFNVLNSCIIFNQIDIITHVQSDMTFLRDVVRLFVDEEVLGTQIKVDGNGEGMDVDLSSSQPEEKPNGSVVLPNGRTGTYAYSPPECLSEEEISLRREVILLIQQLCVMGKNVQLPARMALFRTLVDRGIIFAIQWALGLPEEEDSSMAMISAAGEILAALLDHDLNGVRGHVLRQVEAIEKEREAGKKGADKAETVMALVCRMMANSRDIAVQSQIGDALKVWLEVQQNDGPDSHAALGIKLLARGGKDEIGTERFMEYFYKNCVEMLFKPFNDVPDFRTFTDPLLNLTRERTNLYLYLSDLLCNFALQHSFRSHFFMLSSNVTTKVATLLRTKDKHLRLAAFRLFRICLKLNNRNLFNHLIKNDVLKPVLNLTLEESRRDTLLSSSCQEFFDHMRRENMKDLIKHCMTKHEPEIRRLAESPLGGPRFISFIRRWEMNNEPLPPEDDKTDKPIETRPWPGQGRIIEAEEEDYFNADDDEDDVIPSISSQYIRGQAPSPANSLKRKRRGAIANTSRGFRPLPGVRLRSSTPPLGPLVEYDDDDDDLGGVGPVGENISGLSSPSIPRRRPPSPQTMEIPSSPLLSHRQVVSMPPRRQVEDDDEDNFLNKLMRSKAPSPLPSHGAAPFSMGPMRLSEKRRRDEDEEDGTLERLSKAKRPDIGPLQTSSSPGSRSGSTKPGDDPPKKIKLKFGANNFGKASLSRSTPSEGTKDRDTG